MFGSDWWSPFWGFPLFPIIFMVLGLLFCFLIMRAMTGAHGPWRRRDERWDMPARRPLDILNERFAKGEIDRTEYDEKRRLIFR